MKQPLDISEEQDSLPAGAIREMLDFLFTKVNTHFNSQSYSLLNGQGGEVLFLYYYWAVFKKQNKCFDKLRLVQEASVNDSVIPFPLCNGLSGVSWLLNHIAKSTKKNNSLSQEYDKRIPLLIDKDRNRKNYDLLYGLLGHYICIKEADPESPLLSQENIYDIFASMIKESSDMKIWFDYTATLNASPSESIIPTVNFGFAHGLPSILMFLLLSHAENPHEKIRELIELLIIFMIKTPQKNNPKYNMFPTSIEGQTFHYLQRNAWCYGDIGILYPLLKYQSLFKDNTQVNHLIERLVVQCSLRKLDRCGISDASFCHGTAGLAYMYFKIQRLAPHYVGLSDSLRYWLRRTYDMFLQNEFKTYLETSKESQYVEDYSLLYGYSGIGLALLSIYTEQELKWDRCVLLS